MVLGIPLVVVAAVRVVAARADAHDRLDQVLEGAQPVGLGLLALTIAAIFASHARVVTDNPDAFLRLVASLAAFFAITYLIATAASGALARGECWCRER